MDIDRLFAEYSQMNWYDLVIGWVANARLNNIKMCIYCRYGYKANEYKHDFCSYCRKDFEL